MRNSLFLLLLTMLVACGDSANTRAIPQAPAIGELAEMSQQFGHARACSADLVIKVTQDDGDSLSFTVNTWIAADNTLRLHLSKLGKSFMHARISTNGDIEATQVLDRVAIRSTIDAIHASAIERTDLGNSNPMHILQALRLLCEEIKTGPLPQSDDYQLSKTIPQAVTVALPAGGSVSFIMDQSDVAEKWYHDSDGDELIQLSYRRYNNYDGYRRARSITAHLPEHDSPIKIRCRTFRSAPSISPQTMAINVPPEYTLVGPKAFLDALAGTAPAEESNS